MEDTPSLKMEAACSFETLETLGASTQKHDQHKNESPRERLKSTILISFNSTTSTAKVV
jgi:hypothetical protein